MANRKRCNNASSSRSRRFSPAESPPPHRTDSSRPHARSVYPNDSNVFPRSHPSIRPNAQHRLSQRAHSISEAASTFKASIHNNPFLASRCRVLKSQTAHLKQRLEELITSIEELQPEQSAMDWAVSAGTVVYVPYPVAKDNEPPNASLAPPQIKGSAGSTFPDALQYFRKTNPFRFGNETNVFGTTGYGQAPVQSQPQSYQPTNSGLEGSMIIAKMAARPRTTMEPPRQAAWANYSGNTSSFGKTGGQREPMTGGGTSRTIISQIPVTGPFASHPRHAYVEDETPEALGS